MSVTVDLQEFQKRSIDNFRKDINRVSFQFPEIGLGLWAGELSARFDREVVSPSLGRCVTMAFFGVDAHSSETLAIPVFNAAKSNMSTRSVSHDDTARWLSRQAKKPYDEYWGGFAWAGDRLAVMVPAILTPDLQEQYTEAFHDMAEKTPEVDYFCSAIYAPPTQLKIPSNVHWDHQYTRGENW